MLRERPTADRPAAFVVSTGRCGSTLLSDMIRLHPALLSLSELFAVVAPDAFPAGDLTGEAFWELLSRPRKRWTLMMRFDIGIDEMLYRPGAATRFTAETGVPPLLLIPLPHLTGDHEALYDELADVVPRLAPAPVGVQYRRLFDWLCDRLGRRAWIERSGSSLQWLAEFERHFPDARFVHMYRDGRDCAVSMSQHNAYKLTRICRQLYQRIGVDPFASDDPPLVPPPRALLPFMPDTFDRERYLSLQVPVEDMGANWSSMVLSGWEALSRIPSERVMHIAFERLAADPRGELRRLAAFLDVPAGEAWLAEAARLVRPTPPRWTRLPEPQRRRLVDVCAPAMELLYGKAAAGAAPGPAAG